MTRPRPSVLRRCLLALWLGLSLVLMPGPGVWAQQADGGQTDAAADTTAQGGVDSRQAEAPDYDAWERVAQRAESVLADRDTTGLALEQLRAQLAEWRDVLQSAQSINSSRIAILREQIAALGPAPEAGQTEAAEIAGRRNALGEQLVRLQAPGLAADEAYRRADGLISEIDRVLRDRQADELLRLWPAPINPANWPAAVRALSDTTLDLATELQRGWAQPERRARLADNLPLILILLAVALGLVWRGRSWMEQLTLRLQEHASARGRTVWALLVSLGQVVLPMLGVLSLTEALRLTAMPGTVGTGMVEALPAAGFGLFAAFWLGGRVFPKGVAAEAPLRLSAERRAEGRFHVLVFGSLLALEALRAAAMNPLQVSDAAKAVLMFPAVAVAGLLLVRLAQLVLIHVRNDAAGSEVRGYRDRIFGLLARGALLCGVAGPVLAAVGYVSAGTALVFPAALSLALAALLVILQQLIGDVYALAARRDVDGREALAPVLVGFGLTVLTLPLFALIWGVRVDDLAELWTRFRAGFQLGDTRISPTNFLYFAVLFTAGFTVTRLFQGALKSTILPKTSLDQGGQNAVVAGVGYVGIFLSGLVAINAAGIDLSGLAIVAGALSVGIGFGLQNVVSNFVSGIILLIERPVSEGDWIEVGGVQGTVKSISVRSTRIQTFDRTDVIVPNTDLVAGQVTNWTRFNLSGRLIVPIGVAYGSDTRKVERILREIANAQPLALLNPPPMVVFMGFGTDALNFEIRLILSDVNFTLAVRSEINHAIADRFAAEGVEMPFAQRDLWLRNPEALYQAIHGTSPPAPQAVPMAAGAAPGPLQSHPDERGPEPGSTREENR